VYESHGRKHVLTEPTLIFYPKGRRHSIQSRTLQGCDLVCATVSFQDSPLLRAMPEVVVIPLSELTHLESVLSLLFDEAFSQRYGYVASIAHLLDLLLILLIRHLVAEPANLPDGSSFTQSATVVAFRASDKVGRAGGGLQWQCCFYSRI